MKQAEVFAAWKRLLELRDSKKKAQRDLDSAKAMFVKVDGEMPSAVTAWESVKAEYLKTGARTKVALIDALSEDLEQEP
jgi:hypothetical protein